MFRVMADISVISKYLRANAKILHFKHAHRLGIDFPTDDASKNCCTAFDVMFHL